MSRSMWKTITNLNSTKTYLGLKGSSIRMTRVTCLLPVVSERKMTSLYSNNISFTTSRDTDNNDYKAKEHAKTDLDSYNDGFSIVDDKSLTSFLIDKDDVEDDTDEISGDRKFVSPSFEELNKISHQSIQIKHLNKVSSDQKDQDQDISGMNSTTELLDSNSFLSPRQEKNLTMTLLLESVELYSSCLYIHSLLTRSYSYLSGSDYWLIISTLYHHSRSVGYSDMLMQDQYPTIDPADSLCPWILLRRLFELSVYENIILDISAYNCILFLSLHAQDTKTAAQIYKHIHFIQQEQEKKRLFNKQNKLYQQQIERLSHLDVINRQANEKQESNQTDHQNKILFSSKVNITTSSSSSISNDSSSNNLWLNEGTIVPLMLLLRRRHDYASIISLYEDFIYQQQLQLNEWKENSNINHQVNPSSVVCQHMMVYDIILQAAKARNQPSIAIDAINQLQHWEQAYQQQNSILLQQQHSVSLASSSNDSPSFPFDQLLLAPIRSSITYHYLIYWLSVFPSLQDSSLIMSKKLFFPRLDLISLLDQLIKEKVSLLPKSIPLIIKILTYHKEWSIRDIIQKVFIKEMENNKTQSENETNHARTINDRGANDNSISVPSESISIRNPFNCSSLVHSCLKNLSFLSFSGIVMEIWFQLIRSFEISFRHFQINNHLISARTSRQKANQTIKKALVWTFRSKFIQLEPEKTIYSHLNEDLSFLTYSSSLIIIPNPLTNSSLQSMIIIIIRSIRLLMSHQQYKNNLKSIPVPNKNNSHKSLFFYIKNRSQLSQISALIRNHYNINPIQINSTNITSISDSTINYQAAKRIETEVNCDIIDVEGLRSEFKRSFNSYLNVDKDRNDVFIVAVRVEELKQKGAVEKAQETKYTPSTSVKIKPKKKASSSSSDSYRSIIEVAQLKVIEGIG